MQAEQRSRRARSGTARPAPWRACPPMSGSDDRSPPYRANAMTPAASAISAPAVISGMAELVGFDGGGMMVRRWYSPQKTSESEDAITGRAITPWENAGRSIGVFSELKELRPTTACRQTWRLGPGINGC